MLEQIEPTDHSSQGSHGLSPSDAALLFPQLCEESRHSASGPNKESKYLVIPSLPIGFGPQNWEEKHRVSVFPSHIYALYLVTLPLPWQQQPIGKGRSLARPEETARGGSPSPPLPPFSFSGREQLSQTTATPGHALFCHSSLTFAGGGAIAIIRSITGCERESCVKTPRAEGTEKAGFIQRVERKGRMDTKICGRVTRAQDESFVGRPEFRVRFSYFLSCVT